NVRSFRPLERSRHMVRLTAFVLATLLSPALPLAQRGGATAPVAPTVDGAFYSVGYLAGGAASRSAATAALVRYRDASQKQEGCIRVELFEQAGRPGHFALFDTWRDQMSFDLRGVEVPRALTEALEPLRLSAYDQRPYKTLVVGSAPATLPAGAVVVITHVDTSPSPQVPLMLTRLADARRKEAAVR